MTKRSTLPSSQLISSPVINRNFEQVRQRRNIAEESDGRITITCDERQRLRPITAARTWGLHISSPSSPSVPMNPSFRSVMRPSCSTRRSQGTCPERDALVMSHSTASLYVRQMEGAQDISGKQASPVTLWAPSNRRKRRTRPPSCRVAKGSLN